MWVGPPRHVARRVDPRHAGLEKFIDEDAAVRRDPGPVGEVRLRTHADSGDDEIRIQPLAALERDIRATDLGRGLAEPEDDAMLLVKRPDEVAELRSEHPLERTRFGSDDGHVETASPQSGRDLEADEARAQHDRPFRLRRGFDDRATVGKRSQIMNALARLRDVESHRRRARRDQQRTE
jgi:hypothetical protein